MISEEACTVCTYACFAARLRSARSGDVHLLNPCCEVEWPKLCMWPPRKPEHLHCVHSIVLNVLSVWWPLM
jgi:hypothetical protein